MPLLDHFRAPVSTRHRWESFHACWAITLMESLNARLPQRFFAEAQIHVGRKIEADVAEFERTLPPGEVEVTGNGHPDGAGGVAVAVAEPIVYAPPEPDMAFPLKFEDAFEIKVYDTDRDQRLVAVIELVSPSNKDRPEERETFALKSLGYLKAGIGLVIVDIVTDRQFNLHNELIRVGRTDDRYRMTASPTTYAVAYRPVRRDDENLIDMWAHELSLATRLPTVPLALMGYGCVRLDLEGTYTEACAKSRIT